MQKEKVVSHLIWGPLPTFLRTVQVVPVLNHSTKTYVGVEV
jgi:hypothetical protein